MLNDNKPLVSDASDEGQVRHAERKFKHSREVELNDLCFVLGSIQGRRFVWRYLEECGVMRTSFNGELTHSTAFAEGSRNVGLKMLADVNEALPSAYLQMVEESKRRNKNDS